MRKALPGLLVVASFLAAASAYVPFAASAQLRPGAPRPGGLRSGFRFFGSPALPSNILLNGDFSGGTTSWVGFGYNGKSVTGGKAVFSGTTAYDGINQPVTLPAGKYCDVTYTLVRTSGTIYVFFSGGAASSGTQRVASGTYTERLLVGAGNNNFGMQSTDTATMTIDDVSVVCPYDTP